MHTPNTTGWALPLSLTSLGVKLLGTRFGTELGLLIGRSAVLRSCTRDVASAMVSERRRPRGEYLKHLGPLVALRNLACTLAHWSFQVRVSTRCEQRLDGLDVASARGEREWRPAAPARRRVRHIVAQQQAQRCHVTRVDSGVDAAVGHPNLVAAQRRIGAVPQEQLRNLEVDPVDILLKIESQVQRRPVVQVANIDIRIVLQQQLDHLAAWIVDAERHMQSRPVASGTQPLHCAVSLGLPPLPRQILVRSVGLHVRVGSSFKQQHRAVEVASLHEYVKRVQSVVVQLAAQVLDCVFAAAQLGKAHEHLDSSQAVTLNMRLVRHCHC
mmetsp:Transcript_10030/g.26745  ORF Transcript_10030/g.26745 Transcript_10030/m.26745 type:complete len:327 (+) Transcript_10030:104-1084(+)